VTEAVRPTNVIVYLVGFAGTGKLTIAKELAPLLDATIVDNHWINNPIFGLIKTDGMTPLPLEVWVQVDKVREAVLETIATLAPPACSFILTHDGREGEPEDRAIYEAIRATAERRAALFVPVRLLCAEEELVRRVIAPERKGKLKSIDPDAARRSSRTRTVLDPRHPHGLTLDVTAVQPAETARLILRHAQCLCSAGSG
jgi:predicted kinase